MVRLAGHVNTGARLSSTNMVCTQVLELPQSSVATHVRVMVLSCGQDAPVVISVNVTTGSESQLSVAVAVPVAGGKVLAVHAIVIFGGQVITGGVSSCTRIIWIQVLELPQSSVAFHVLVIV